MWKKILLGWKLITRGIKWSLGNENRINFWHDSWLDLQPLICFFIGPIKQETSLLLVKDILHNNINLDNVLSFVIPSSLKERIHDSSSLNRGSQEDIFLWKHTPIGNFTTNSACTFLCQVFFSTIKKSQSFMDYSWIWKSDILNKHKTFLWLAYRNKLPTRELLYSRSVVFDRQCLFYSLEIERIDHIFRRCIYAQHIWQSLSSFVSRPILHSLFSDEDLQSWLKIH